MINKDEQIKKLTSEIDKLKRDLAFKKEELQALYMEFKNKSNLIDELKIENHSLKQQIKQLEKEAEELLLYP